MKDAGEATHLENLLHVILGGRQAEVTLLVARLFQGGQERAQAGAAHVTHLAQVSDQLIFPFP